jgi:hypothetical protein
MLIICPAPYVMYFHGNYGLHGTYWHSNFGQLMSHGCVNLPTAAGVVVQLGAAGNPGSHALLISGV